MGEQALQFGDFIHGELGQGKMQAHRLAIFIFDYRFTGFWGQTFFTF